MSKSKWLILLIFVILVGGLVYGFSVISSINRQITTAMQPVINLNNGLSTQIADILHPTPTIRPDPVTIIHAILPLARLETIKYSVEKVITAETNQGLLKDLIGEKMLFVAHGQVIAGVDLAKINLSNLSDINGQITLDLPDAEVFNTVLDNQKSYIYDWQTGFFTKGDPRLETSVRQAAEKEIESAALNDGILTQASQNAVVFLTNFLIKLGYLNVIVIP
jgi:hypothetical protein